MDYSEQVKPIAFKLLTYTLAGAWGLRLAMPQQSKKFVVEYYPSSLDQNIQHAVHLDEGEDIVIFLINPATSDNWLADLLLDLAHETVHYCQICRGDVVFLGPKQVNWLGTIYDQLPSIDGPAYRAQPWEAEAYYYEAKIKDYVIEELHKIRNDDPFANQILIFMGS